MSNSDELEVSGSVKPGSGEVTYIILGHKFTQPHTVVRAWAINKLDWLTMMSPDEKENTAFAIIGGGTENVYLDAEEAQRFCYLLLRLAEIAEPKE